MNWVERALNRVATLTQHQTKNKKKKEKSETTIKYLNSDIKLFNKTFFFLFYDVRIESGKLLRGIK